MNHLAPVDIACRTISLERHYRPKELSEMWGFSEDTIRRWFADEPGVLKVGGSYHRNGKRGYVSLSIPESVAQRIHLARSR